MKREDFQIIGRELMVKSFTGTKCGKADHYNWKVVAEFYYSNETPEPAEMAKALLNSIVDD